MEEHKLISVIIPVFNVTPYLIESLESVVNQTYNNLEIIIIDDGSTDGSGSICDEYAIKDKRICVIHQENKGLSAARNLGIDMMTGDAVAFLDSDDAYRSDYIETMLDAMNLYGVDIVICRDTVHYTTGIMHQSGTEKPIPLIQQGLIDRVDSLRALAEGTINPNVWNKLYKASLWENVRFPLGHVYEDIAVMHTLFNRCIQLYVVNEPLYMRRRHRGSITDTCNEENTNDWLRAYSEFEVFVKENIPEIFTYDHLNRVRQFKLNRLIASYLWFSREQDSETENYCIELRRQICETGKSTEVGNIKMSARVAYWMIDLCPQQFKKAYHVYHSIRSKLCKPKKGFSSKFE